MAEPLTQYRDDIPIIRDTPIVSGAKGFESVAKSLGNVSPSESLCS